MSYSSLPFPNGLFTTARFSRRVGLAICFIGCAGGVYTLQAQLCAQLSGPPFSENFNALANSGANNQLPNGFEFAVNEAGGNLTYTADNGSASTADTYSYGAAGTSERALGELTSASVQTTIGACFVNNTSRKISSFTISYTGEEWRLGAADAEIDGLDFQYSTEIGATLTTGTYTDVDALDFTTPNNAAPAGAKNGNAGTNRTIIGPVTITPPGGIPPGATFYIRWLPRNISINDGLAIDDFVITLPDYPTWDGGGTNNNWSTSTNWTLDTAPFTAIGLIFPDNAPLDSRTCTNDISPLLELNSLTITGTNYILKGNQIKLHGGLAVNVPGTSAPPATISLNASLLESQRFQSEGRGYSFNGSLTLVGVNLTLDGSGNHTFVGAINDNIQGGLTILGTGSSQVTLSGTNSYRGVTHLSSGTLVVNGSNGPSPIIITGGTLGGTGFVATIVGIGGKIAPGTSAGILNATGDVMLNANATLAIEIGGLTAGTEHDRLNAVGTVNLGGAMLSGTLTNGFVPVVGNQFTIVQASGGVTGRFAQNTGIVIGGQVFNIVYNANSVVLVAAGGSSVVINSITAAPQAGQQSVSIFGNAEPAGSNVQLERNQSFEGWSIVTNTTSNPGNGNFNFNTQEPLATSNRFYRAKRL